jgi:7-cyano-7-deazaguanine synthase
MEKNKKKAVISLSGGMDSTSLLIHLLANNYEVYALSFDYGQKHKIEIDKLQTNLNYLSKIYGYHVIHNIVDLSILGKLFNSALTDSNWKIPEGHYADENMKQTVVPNRNAIFSSIIYGYALSIAMKKNCNVEICLGVHSGDHSIYPDCTPAFYNKIDAAFKEGNWDSEKVSYYLLYMSGDKFSILQDAIKSCEKLNIDFDFILKNTNTCYNPNSKGFACGKCGSCSERLEAFEKLGIKDPIDYI